MANKIALVVESTAVARSSTCYPSSMTMSHRDQVLRPRNSQYAGNPQAPCGAEVENCFDCDLPRDRPDTADAASHQAASSRQTSLHSRYSPPSRLRQHEA